MTHNICTDTQWLFAKNVFVFFDSLEGLICMGSGDCGNHDSPQASMLQELIVVGVYGCTMWFELLVAPLCFAVIEGPGGDHVCSKCSLQKVYGVSTAHTA